MSFFSKFFKSGRRAAPAKGTCDLCAAQIGRGGSLVSADDMRRAARAGLRASSSPLLGSDLKIGSMSELLGVDPKLTDDAWLAQVQRDQTDWGLCKRCTALVDEYILGQHFRHSASRSRRGEMMIVVEAVSTTPDGSTVVSGRLRQGNNPLVGDTIRVLRTDRVGRVEDISVLGDDSLFKKLGIRVVYAISEETMRSSIGLRISGIAADEILTGDEIVEHHEENSDRGKDRERGKLKGGNQEN